MGKRIGTIITELRKEAGYTQKQLCCGLYSPPEMVRIEADALTPGHFQLDRLFGRLGKSTERLEYVLSKEIYELYELQYRIQTAICHREFSVAEELLRKYERKKQAKNALHIQFIMQERAQIAWIQREETGVILEYLNRAITQTMPEENSALSESALSVEELKLLLFRWEVCYDTAFARNPGEVWDILRYIEKRNYDAEEKVKVYPYVVLLMVEYFETEGQREYFTELLAESLELLREEGKILYMPETLEAYAFLLENGENNSEQLREMRDALLSLEEEFGMHFEKYRLFQHLNRAFELDYEMIRKCRLACKMSQEELSEGICTRETLSRIERGKTRPTNTNLQLLLERLNRRRERIGMVVDTEQFEIIALEKKIAKAVQRFEYERVEKLLKQLEEQLDMSAVENQQYILSEKIRIKVNKKEMDYQEAIEKLYKIIGMTFDGASEDIFSYKLTHRECNILNQIANLFCDNDVKEEGIRIWKQIIKTYDESARCPAFAIRDWELMMGNLAGVLTEIECIEEALKKCYKRLEIAMKVGKGNEFGRAITILGCIMEVEENPLCTLRFQQALNILKLMKMKYRYICLKNYMEERNII